MSDVMGTRGDDSVILMNSDVEVVILTPSFFC